MNFKVRKIKQEKKQNAFFLWGKRVIRSLGGKLALFFLILLVLGGTFWAGAHFVRSVFLSQGPLRPTINFSPLKKDAQGHTNILLLGIAGDGGEGEHLSDSVMVASLNPEGSSVSFLSLPRDLYVDSSVEPRRLNEVYAVAQYRAKNEKKGLQVVEDAVSDFTGVEIHYAAVIDFNIFEDVVDALGGIELFVPEDINDPYYPDENYGFQTFVIRKGIQNLDGETALKYARSRKTSSDYDRARRQQDLLMAIKEKAQEKALFSDFDRLKEFYDIYKENVITDLGMTELVALSRVILDIDYSSAVVAVLHDDPTTKGGFLYTPAREFYGGRFVLLPQDLKETQLYMDLVLLHPEVFLEKTQIAVLNGSMISGKAREVADRIKRLGLHVIEVGNFETDMPVFRTRLRVLNPEKKKTIETLKRVFETDIVDIVPPEEIPEKNLIDIELILGTN